MCYFRVHLPQKACKTTVNIRMSLKYRLFFGSGPGGHLLLKASTTIEKLRDIKSLSIFHCKLHPNHAIVEGPVAPTFFATSPIFSPCLARKSDLGNLAIQTLRIYLMSLYAKLVRPLKLSTGCLPLPHCRRSNVKKRISRAPCVAI